MEVPCATMVVSAAARGPSAPDPKPGAPSALVVRNRREAMVPVDGDASGPPTGEKDVRLLTDASVLVGSQALFFDYLWDRAQPVE